MDSENGERGEAPDFDFAYLDNYTSGDAELQKEVLQLFFGQIESLVEKLEPRGGHKDWHAGAHAIKGSARGVGLHHVGDLCEQMEKLKDVDAAVRGASLAELKAALGRAKVAVAVQYDGIFDTRV